ncbi:MAG: hypothetical protein J5838_07875, partial [Desulfovibrio sp.]|nr:hypothetical protein [Desulfovibrio sp.]
MLERKKAVSKGGDFAEDKGIQASQCEEDVGATLSKRSMSSRMPSPSRAEIGIACGRASARSDFSWGESLSH